MEEGLTTSEAASDFMEVVASVVASEVVDTAEVDSEVVAALEV